MREYNLSPNGDHYYRQSGSGPGRNEIDPEATCKPTATVEGLALAGWTLPRGKFVQPEDNLTDLCRSDDGYKIMHDIDPNLKNNPNEVWGVIAWAVNEIWFPQDKPLIGPRWNYHIKEALFGIVKKTPFVASTWLTQYGHVVSIVGYNTRQDAIPEKWQDVDMTAVNEIIIDDPYGNRTSGMYDTKKTGWNNRYQKDVWSKVWRSTGVQIRPKG